MENTLIARVYPFNYAWLSVTTGKGTFSQRIKDKLFSVDPHLLAFVLARNEFKIVQVLSTHWLEITPLLSEAGLMTLTLRKRLTEINCTSCQKADMILAQAVSSPDGPVKLLLVLYRLSSSDRPTGVLMQSILGALLSLSDANVAKMVATRIRQVSFPSANCWPKRLAPTEPLDETLYQQLYCQVWHLARSGKIYEAFAVVNSHRSLHSDVQAALTEVMVTGMSGNATLYESLEDLLVRCQQDTCWNSDLLCARIHKRLVVYYFYTAQDMAKAYHHLYKGYEISTRIEPDEGTVRLISSWGEYMHIVGDYEESRRSFTLAVEHAERVPAWMKPVVEGVKIDKAQFHVHRANLYKGKFGSCSAADKEMKDAESTLLSLDVSILPTAHLSFVHYVQARISVFYKDIHGAKIHTEQAMRLEPSPHSPHHRRAASLHEALSMLSLQPHSMHAST